MIWYFLGGMIAGAVGLLMLAHWWMGKRTVTIRLTKEEWEQIQKMEEEQNDGK